MSSKDASQKAEVAAGYSAGNLPSSPEQGSATVAVTFPGGVVYDVEVLLSGSVLALREGVAKQHEIPAACILKLFQDGNLLLDEDPIAQVDTTSPVFGVVARETKLEVLLQACGKWGGYQDHIEKAVKDAADPKTQVTIPPLPDIITVLTEMGGQAPDLKNLAMGKETGTLEFSGSDGDLILPSIDAAPLLAAAGVDKFAGVTMCIELNSDAFNQGLGVVLEASPLMDSTVDDSGLPSYIYNGYGVSDDKKQNAIKFHPGMRGGQLRVEGAGGWHNSEIGFTPENWSGSGKKYHTLELTVRADGKNEMCIKGTRDGQEWRRPWTRQLTSGRHFPAIYAWLDLGSREKPLHIRNISMTVHLKPDKE
eukprot:TRINITY_DN72638_c0_g1_i1.p1 TRINITY_DN72638_c0_g1~~TRINITY_DN72638_c0_g1_i1.p1  ORF type:complete len:372 (-),score=83.32 TRINITY_DN72638_c0_g1_i1:86-1180(-)